MKKSIRIGELFCGAGGFAIGADMAAQALGVRARHVWATDYSEAACLTYRWNYPNCEVYQADIKRIRFDQLEEVDGLTFGFPCNSFSVVGRREGMRSDRYGNLFEYCSEALSVLQPDWFIAENVAHLMRIHGGQAYETILRSFSDAGYAVKARVLRFEYLGVPQTRHRLVFVGFRNDLELRHSFKWPRSSDIPEVCGPWLEDIEAHDPLHVKSVAKGIIKDVMHAIRPGSNYKSCLDRIPPEHRPAYRDPSKIFATYYSRLHKKQPSPTITADGGGGQWPLHPEEDRELTIRELARIQTFPDSYMVLGGTKRANRSLVGMAVPPIGISRVYKQVWKAAYGLV